MSTEESEYTPQDPARVARRAAWRARREADEARIVQQNRESAKPKYGIAGVEKEIQRIKGRLNDLPKGDKLDSVYATYEKSCNSSIKLLTSIEEAHKRGKIDDKTIDEIYKKYKSQAPLDKILIPDHNMRDSENIIAEKITAIDELRKEPKLRSPMEEARAQADVIKQSLSNQVIAKTEKIKKNANLLKQKLQKFTGMGSR